MNTMRMARTSFLPVMALLVAFFPQGSLADPWDLRDYDLCSSTRLQGIKSEASGVTYSAVTNSIWVITRRPPVMAEYSMSGKFLRKISHEDAKFRDPEGESSKLIRGRVNFLPSWCTQLFASGLAIDGDCRRAFGFAICF